MSTKIFDPQTSDGAAARGGRAWLKSLLWRDRRGSSIVEVALMLPFLGLLLAGVIDFGRAYYLSIEVNNAAFAGAEYGSQNETDTAGMQAAATADAHDVPGFTPVASYGCECSDGTSASVSCAKQPTCSVNAVNYVQVTTSATYTPIIKWPFIPSSFTLSGSAKLRAGL